MPVGTKLLMQRVGTSSGQHSERYVGQRGDEHVIEATVLDKDGNTRFVSQVFYDMQGRKLRLERNGASTQYLPFSCEYVIGDCTHTSSYPHTFEPGTKYSTSESRFRNRREGNTLIIGHIKTDGSLLERPYTLGPFNLRTDSVVINALGQVGGYELIELSKPPG